MSSHICVPNIGQNVSAIKRDETCLELSEKWPTKAVLDTIIVIELTGYL